MKVINLDKNENIIKDLSKIKVPQDIQEDIFKILNPTLTIKKDKE